MRATVKGVVLGWVSMSLFLALVCLLLLEAVTYQLEDGRLVTIVGSSWSCEFARRSLIAGTGTMTVIPPWGEDRIKVVKVACGERPLAGFGDEMADAT